jgi:hypothetical protein
MSRVTCSFCEQPIAPGEAEYLPCPPTREPDPVCSECWVPAPTDARLEALLDWDYY